MGMPMKQIVIAVSGEKGQRVVHQDGQSEAEILTRSECCGGEKNQEQMPSLGTMAKNLGGSLAEIAKSGVKLCDGETYHKRFSTCQACDRLQNGRCLECGCFMKLKSKLAAMKCPLGKWEI